jgi:transposase-like protein
MIRAAMRFVNCDDRKAVAAALKPIYQAADADAARIELEAFTASELGRRIPPPSLPLETSGSVSRAIPRVPADAAPGSSMPPTASSR